MARRVVATTALVAWALASIAFAQTNPPASGGRGGGGGPTRPPLFFSESWKALPTPPDDHGEWPAGQAGVANPNLQLSLHGPSGKDIMLVAVRGRADVYPLNLWTGVTTSPIGATLRDKDNFVDLTDPLSKIRWVVRTSGFHQIRPLIKSADGTWLVGDSTTGPFVDFNQTDVSIAGVRWMKIDIARMVTVGVWVDRPDLSKVDEVGFADLMPGSGHGSGGYVNVAQIQVFGSPVKRSRT
jgi:hypothetical protein